MVSQLSIRGIPSQDDDLARAVEDRITKLVAEVADTAFLISYSDEGMIVESRNCVVVRLGLDLASMRPAGWTNISKVVCHLGAGISSILHDALENYPLPRIEGAAVWIDIINRAYEQSFTL